MSARAPTLGVVDASFAGRIERGIGDPAHAQTSKKKCGRDRGNFDSWFVDCSAPAVNTSLRVET